MVLLYWCRKSCLDCKARLWESCINVILAACCFVCSIAGSRKVMAPRLWAEGRRKVFMFMPVLKNVSDYTQMGLYGMGKWRGDMEGLMWILYMLFFYKKPSFLPSLNILKFSDFEPRIILKLFLNTKGVISPKYLRNIFQSFLMSYFIIKLSKSYYFVSIMQKYIWKQYYN